MWVARQSGRVGRWRPAAITGGLAAAAVGAWLLYAAGVDAWRVGTVAPGQIEGVVRGMTETNGEPPARLKLTPAGWGRMGGTAEVSGRTVDMTVELRVEGNEVRAVWTQTPRD